MRYNIICVLHTLPFLLIIIICLGILSILLHNFLMLYYSIIFHTLFMHCLCMIIYLSSPLFFFFLFSFIFISWRLITSQHFSGFCHTLTWISHGVTCIPHPDSPLPPPSPPDSSGSSQCTRPEHLSHACTWVGDLLHYR